MCRQALLPTQDGGLGAMCLAEREHRVWRPRGQLGTGCPEPPRSQQVSGHAQVPPLRHALT